MAKDKFSFGKKAKMSEVPVGAKAVVKFMADPTVVETEWGEKFSFSILLISHPSHEHLPLEVDWETKSDVAKEIYHQLNLENPNKDFVEAYNKSEWQLTRTDTGTYWIDQL